MIEMPLACSRRRHRGGKARTRARHEARKGEDRQEPEDEIEERKTFGVNKALWDPYA
jgi:hypothetical protein